MFAVFEYTNSLSNKYNYKLRPYAFECALSALCRDTTTIIEWTLFFYVIHTPAFADFLPRLRLIITTLRLFIPSSFSSTTKIYIYKYPLKICFQRNKLKKKKR